MEDDPTLWMSLMTLNSDVLCHIFQFFDHIFESTSAVARFCEAWQKACCDSPLWQTLDFSMLKSHYIKVKSPPYVYVASYSDRSLSHLLFTALSLSQGNITTLIFHYNLYLSNYHFTCVATR